MTTEVRSTTTRGHTKARESTTQKTTQILGTPVHHSKAKTPIAKISKQMRRTVPALRAKAHQLGIGLAHQR